MSEQKNGGKNEGEAITEIIDFFNQKNALRIMQMLLKQLCFDQPVGRQVPEMKYKLS